MHWRSPSVLATGAGLFALFAAGAFCAEPVRLLRVATDAQAVVVRTKDASLRVVRVGERVEDSAWTLHQVTPGSALFAYGTNSTASSLLVEVNAGQTFDIDRTPVSDQVTAHPGVIATHVVPVQPGSERAP